MKIVTYNINGIRPRIAQFGSLLKLLDSLDADIICFQETKISRQDLTTDLVLAQGYECFFSCTRTSDKGRVSYSGVATFCRVKSSFSSNEVALPLAAEEGFTGVLDRSNGEEKTLRRACGLEDFTKDELIKVDSEGRCVITDHGHFVLFNIYGPRAVSDDTDRVQFKKKFYQILQKRWEVLTQQGRRIIVVGDLNIAPTVMDSCHPKPDFEKNEFRTWFRSILVNNGGSFFDVFRTLHPERREAYTQWPQNTGAEEFNYGSRIDHILVAGPCLHEEYEQKHHDIVACHVKDCDILVEFKRCRPGSSPRRKGGRNIKIEGSDHVPVFITMEDFQDVELHNTPTLSARYAPEIRGFQQTIVSVLMKRQMEERRISDNDEMQEGSGSISDEKYAKGCNEGSSGGDSHLEISYSRQDSMSSSLSTGVKTKKPRRSQDKQLSLTSFFQSSSKSVSCSTTKESNTEEEVKIDVNTEKEEKRNVVLQEWQRIHQLMQDSFPLCKVHQEPCVDRIVKKAGPNFGRRFYVCARGEGPASNPESNCGYFKWAASKPKGER
ncbi:DNA-(apurinic or apyrimidinic site) endonuclease 2 [Impatiens glandulifera]|uniref:DNA-(apurinic or apyrimidinic site) endonuclease 2 n=1 Tax=Impatiens glandulifera TaxID=253017 RepID=UPI001FB0A686|nr:DNA-(apurinic or apyrimidinic site) endonuclease 2 [Impatiens glandulifera]